MPALLASHGSGTDVLVNGNIVSQYFNDLALSGARDKAEAVGFKALFKSYVAGLIDMTATLSGLFDSSNATAEDPLIYGYLTSLTTLDNMWLYAPNGAQGASAQNAIAYSLTAQSTKYEVKSVLNDANKVTAELQMDQGAGGLDRGVILSPWATQSAGNSASFNSGVVSTTNGGVIIVHAFSDTASLVVNLQDSADNATWANVTSYTLSPTNATIAAYRYPAAGTVPSGTIRQYTRFSWTGTGTFLAMFSRK